MKEDATIKALRKLESAAFKKADTRAYRSLIRRQQPNYWQQAGARKALRLFHAAAARVPAYKDILKKQRIRATSIETPEDFSKLPVLTKENYIQTYSLADRSWDGDLRGHSLLAMSSGTSGRPTIWPRGAYQEAEAAFLHEFLLTDLYEIDTYRTLMVIGFPMGIYVSGIATAIPSLVTAFRHPNLSVVTAGNSKDSVLSVLQTMQGEYQQIILVGHPFFIKDVIEGGKDRDIDWSRQRVKTIFCSEGFNETWRKYIAALVHSSAQHTLFSTYGSSEFLLTAFENPITIAIREIAEKNSTFQERVFKSPLTPSLFQYNPLSRFIESSDTDLIITAASGIPLIRFNQHDMGNVISYTAMADHIRSEQSLRKISKTWRPWRLPFVSLYGRSDRTMIFYAANIYPEHIQSALNDRRYIKKLTGKFFMEKKYLTNMDQSLHVHIELGPKIAISPSLAKKLQAHIVNTLESVNLEYLFLRKNLQKDIVPRVTLWQYQDPNYFKPGLKPQYLKKE
jgi:phenylacetate-CoA ligase